MSDERARWRAAGVAVLALAIIALAVAINPANLPESWLERWLEGRLPQGSSIVAVRQAIDEKGWQTVDEWVSADGSLVLVHMGNAWLSRRYVYVYFGLDRFGRLTSIDVQKHATRITSTSAASPDS
ncbi:MAG: hypothetical protein ACXWH7_13910 [Thermoanaerobaculia bacterium]